MKLSIESATLGNAVSLQDKKSYVFITSLDPKNKFEMEYDTEAQLLFVKKEGIQQVKLIGIVNIKEMTLHPTSNIEKKSKKAE